MLWSQQQRRRRLLTLPLPLGILRRGRRAARSSHCQRRRSGMSTRRCPANPSSSSTVSSAFLCSSCLHGTSALCWCLGLPVLAPARAQMHHCCSAARARRWCWKLQRAFSRQRSWAGKWDGQAVCPPVLACWQPAGLALGNGLRRCWQRLACALSQVRLQQAATLPVVLAASLAPEPQACLLASLKRRT